MDEATELIEKPFKWRLGSPVKDKITGFEGIVRCQARYLTGCNQYGVQSKKLTKEGNPSGWIYFDEDQLEAAKGKNISYKKKNPGGPQEFTPPGR